MDLQLKLAMDRLSEREQIREIEPLLPFLQENHPSSYAYAFKIIDKKKVVWDDVKAWLDQ